MFKSKSFRINHEVDKKPRVHELLYETKRLRWMKFFIIPLLIAFSLLLVLCNVSFSGEPYEQVVTSSGESHTIATQTPTKDVITTASIDYITPMAEYGLDIAESDGKEEQVGAATDVAMQYWDEAQAVVTAKTFTCTDNHSCQNVICTGGPIYTILVEFDYLINWCGNKYFDVIIEDCTFNKNTIGRYTFSGNFQMSTLTIRNCQLDAIVDNAFKYQSVNKLTNLTFVDVQLKALNAQTFIGLETVKNFQLFNMLEEATPRLNANNFLQPMAASLSNLVLQQAEQSGSCNNIYDPTQWLGGNSATVYSKLLFVDLSGTNFNDTLNGKTFRKLSAVQELLLASCGLSTIAESVFSGISSTLKSLDLRYNRLQTLDGEFLATALLKGISIELGWNLWRCDCDNMEIIEHMKKVENNSAAGTLCATPKELQGTEIRFAQMRCDDTTMLSTIITTITSTVATATTTAEATPIITTITVETTLETTESNRKTPPTFTTIAINNSTTGIITTTAEDTTEETTEPMNTVTPPSSTTANYNSTLTTSAATSYSPVTTASTNNITNTIATASTSTSVTTEGTTDVSESTESEPTAEPKENEVSVLTDSTSHSTMNTTISPTTPEDTIITNSSATTTSETITPPTSLMTSTTDDDSTIETSESIATTTPQLNNTTNDNTTLNFFPGTTIIPITTINTTAVTTEGTDTPEIETTTINETYTTLGTITTQESIPPMATCFRNNSPKFLVCTDIIAIRLCDYDVTFNVVPISSRSVQLQIGDDANGLQAIYSQLLNNSINEVEIGSNSKIDIDNLAPNGSYTFCLIPKRQISTSPFNCRSAHLPLEKAQSWLEHSDVVLFSTIAILVTVVCAIIGVAVIYFLLRWRPTLLYGNKRLRRMASTSHEVLLFPKPDLTSLDSRTYALTELSKMHSSVSDTLTPENYLNIKSYDYMQYFKDIELEKQRKVAHISLNQPPVHRAPALPPNVEGAALHRCDRKSYFSGYIPIRQLSQQSIVVMEDAPQQQGTRGGAAVRLPPDPVDVLENEYESLDYYQELY